MYFSSNAAFLLYLARERYRADVLGWLASGMSHDQILSDYPELTEEDIRACLAYAADRERRVSTSAA